MRQGEEHFSTTTHGVLWALLPWQEGCSWYHAHTQIPPCPLLWLLDIRWLDFLCSGLFCFTFAGGVGRALASEGHQMRAFRWWERQRADVGLRSGTRWKNLFFPLTTWPYRGALRRTPSPCVIWTLQFLSHRARLHSWTDLG